MRVKIWFENRKYYAHLRLIRWIKPIRKTFGWFNSLFINTNNSQGVVKVRKWQLRLCKCVTPDDVYIVTGIYRKLIKSEICEGYENFGINDNTYHAIAKTLRKNWWWNKETMFNSRGDAIKFTWMNYSPISVDNVDEWRIVWCKEDVRGVL